MGCEFGMKSMFCVAGTAILAAALGGCPSGGPGDPLPGGGGEHLIRFVQISDTQIVDEESPARLVRFVALTRSAWRPQEAYGVQTLDATLRVINDRVAAKGATEFPIDFLVATGDLADGCQHNELRWFIDTMDGKAVLPDSGAPDGAERDQEPEDNPKLMYQTEGLNPSIPWYTVFGNHDGYAVGVFNIDRSAEDSRDWVAPLLRPVALLTGLHDLRPPSNEFSPTSDRSPAVIRASEELIESDTLMLRQDLLEAGPVVPDPDRRFVSRKMFIEEHFNTTTQPVGHGFDDGNRETGCTRYSTRPKKDVPVRLLVIDTVAPYQIDGLPAHYGVMTREQFENFVKPEIEAAEDAGEWVLIASHHPSDDFDTPFPGLTVGAREFRRYLTSRTNVVAHICGHTHKNRVTQIDGPNPYYEIETGSIIDYPQEGRILDVYYDEASNSIRLVSEMVSHMENPTRLSAESFRRAEMDALNREIISNEAKALRDELKRAGIASWPGTSPRKEESMGREEDRNFDITFPRVRRP